MFIAGFIIRINEITITIILIRIRINLLWIIIKEIKIRII